MHFPILVVLVPLALATPMKARDMAATAVESSMLPVPTTTIAPVQSDKLAETLKAPIFYEYIMNTIQERDQPPSGEVSHLPDESAPKIAAPVPRKKFFCAAIRLSRAVKKGTTDKWSVSCNSELPIPVWIERFLRQCSTKVHDDNVAYTVKGDKDVAECGYHKQWLMNVPIEESYEAILALEADAGPDGTRTASTRDMNPN